MKNVQPDGKNRRRSSIVTMSMALIERHPVLGKQANHLLTQVKVRVTVIDFYAKP